MCADLFPDEAVEQIAGFTGPGLTRTESMAPVNHEIFECGFHAYAETEDPQEFTIIVDRDAGHYCEDMPGKDGYDAARDLLLIGQGGWQSAIACIDGTVTIETIAAAMGSSPSIGMLSVEVLVASVAEDLRENWPDWEAAAEETRVATLEQR
ncbi:hypothetical protein [Brevibacterium album]|uniref:hypothetical protein n=1 Tax=Brevibacterium album TaxID=417948 RepID=UPI00040F44A6|nr:hypothetical protein [Brevibacterium album]